MSVWLGGANPRTSPRSTTELAGVGIGIVKEDRAALKKNDKKSYQKLRETAVAEMKNKFKQLKAIDAKATMEHLESVYSVVTRFDDLKQELIKSDMIDVFTIPSDFSFDGTIGTFIPSSNATKIDLFKDLNSTDIELIKKANSYFSLMGQDYHGENIQWSGEKILNSCDGPLRDKLIESTRKWNQEEKGGPAYLKLLLSLILSTTDKSLRALTEKLSTIRITEFKGENVNLAVSYIRGVILILTDNHCQPRDLKNIVFRIFKASTVELFKTHVENMDSLMEFQVANYSVDNILTNLDQKYIELLGRNEWSAITTDNQGSAFSLDNLDGIRKIICFNCGGLGHPVPECKATYNQAAIDLRKEIMDTYSSRNGMGRNNGGEKGKSRKNGSGGNKDPYLMPPRQGEPHSKSFNGQLLHWCGKPKCRKWTDHKTHEHVDEPSGSANQASETPATPSNNQSPEGDTSSSPPDDASSSAGNPQAHYGTDSGSVASGGAGSFYHFGSAV